jgi:hypothetical protein
MADLKNADQSFAEYREKFAQMDDENKQLQRQLDDATLKRESAQDRLRALEVGWLVGWLVGYFVRSFDQSIIVYPSFCWQCEIQFFTHFRV